MKDEQKKQEQKKAPEDQGTLEELNLEEMEQVTGGGAFDNVPRVKEYDYNDDIRGRV